MFYFITILPTIRNSWKIYVTEAYRNWIFKTAADGSIPSLYSRILTFCSVSPFSIRRIFKTKNLPTVKMIPIPTKRNFLFLLVNVLMKKKYLFAQSFVVEFDKWVGIHRSHLQHIAIRLVQIENFIHQK